MPDGPEITDPIDLTLKDGTLNPDAIGWTRTPLHRTDGVAKSRRGRNKRWEYWAITTPTHVVGITAASIDYAGVSSLFVLDRTTGVQASHDAITPFGRGVALPGTLDAGPTSVRAPKLSIDLDPSAEGTRIRAEAEGVNVDVVATLPPGHERLGVVVPWTPRTFQYTVKDVGRPVAGSVTIDGSSYDVGADAYATLDHGRGRWPYSIAWNWGAGAGVVHGQRIGLQVGGRWTDGTGSTENSITVDGRLTKIHDDLTWTYNLRHWERDWRVQGGEVDLTFTPEHRRKAATQLGLTASRTVQCFGHWHGHVADHVVAGVYGWAEDVHQRW